MDIKDYGWDEYFGEEWKKNSADGMYPGLVADNASCSPMHPGLVANDICCSPMHPGLVANNICCSPMHPGRIIADYGQMLRVLSDAGEILVNRPVKKLEDIQLAVGDWVALEHSDETQSTHVRIALTRKTKFSRAAAGIEVKEQIVAANVDTVFLIQSLNKDFNMRRLERYLIAAWESGAVPVVVLTKADCCDDVADRVTAVHATSPGVEVHAISCVTGEGIEDIRKYFMPGKTVALLGSSGVGKSTLVNTLAGKELLKTQEIREDDSRQDIQWILEAWKSQHASDALALLPGENISEWSNHGIQCRCSVVIKNNRILGYARYVSSNMLNIKELVAKSEDVPDILAYLAWKKYGKAQGEMRIAVSAGKLQTVLNNASNFTIFDEQTAHKAFMIRIFEQKSPIGSYCEKVEEGLLKPDIIVFPAMFDVDDGRTE